MQNQHGNTGSMIASFAAGAAVGVGVALLLAPKSGKQLRRDLDKMAGELGSKIEHAAEKGKEWLGRAGKGGQQQGSRPKAGQGARGSAARHGRKSSS